MIIPIGITAKNESKNLPVLIASLKESVDFATTQLGIQFEVHALLNDNSDDSEVFLNTVPFINVWHTTGGLVEAQRFLKKMKPEASFLIFSDADLIIEKDCITEICKSMIENNNLQVAYSEKYPLQPKRKSPLARALYLYNLNNGYQNRRQYLNGQLFAIRNWSIPEKTSLIWNAEDNDNFLNLEAGIRCDDIFISRDLLKRYGPESIFCTQTAIWYRPPETLQGMYRKYQRMKLEIERLNYFFPETVKTHQNFGRRRLQKKLILNRPISEISYYMLFLIGLYLCKAGYELEKFYYRYLSKQYCPTWKPVVETKDLT
tara:strand:- start:59126 stop:60076 length:951 start_codon:yes stop_codon:yes gene_type:complete